MKPISDEPACVFDTDGDGDCHHCSRIHSKCFMGPTEEPAIADDPNLGHVFSQIDTSQGDEDHWCEFCGRREVPFRAAVENHRLAGSPLPPACPIFVWRKEKQKAHASEIAAKVAG